MKKYHLYFTIIVSLLFSLHFTVLSFAGWEQQGEDWVYQDVDTQEVVHDKWLFDDGKWYYVGSDGVMLKNTITPDGLYVGSDGAWFSYANSSEKLGPGVKMNKYLDGTADDSSKVKFTNTLFPSLTEKQLAFLWEVADGYKIEQFQNGQELYVVYTAEELSEKLGLNLYEVNGEKCISTYLLAQELNIINHEVLKDTGEGFIYFAENGSVYEGIDNTKIQKLIINEYALKNLTYLKWSKEYINNLLVSELKITEDMSQVEAARRIYWWVVEDGGFSYDLNYESGSGATALIQRKAVCFGFAALYMEIARSCGINCDMEGGKDYYNIGEAGHVWNSITIDGITSYIDTTWGLTSVEHKEKWFMMNLNELTSTHGKYIFVK